MSLSNVRNKAIFSWVYQIHQADGSITGQEHRFLMELAKHLRLTEVEVLAIIDHPEDYPMHPPPSEYERMRILYYLLFAMEVDGEISKKEESKLYQFGLKLGFQPEMLKDMIDVLAFYLGKTLPDEALLGLIKKYAN